MRYLILTAVLVAATAALAGPSDVESGPTHWSDGVPAGQSDGHGVIMVMPDGTLLVGLYGYDLGDSWLIIDGLAWNRVYSGWTNGDYLLIKFGDTFMLFSIGSDGTFTFMAFIWMS